MADDIRPIVATGRRLGAGVILMLAVALAGCKQESNTFVPPPPPEVTVAHPVQQAVTANLEYTGNTEAFETVDLRARVTGFLEEIRFKPGAKVKKDELLFLIDKRPFQATIDRLEAQLHSNEAAWKAAESDAKIAEGLAAQRAGSEIDKITKIGKRDSAKAAVEAAKAAVESARLDLDYCEVRAPIDGRITKNLVDVGNLVGALGQPTILATIVSARPLYVSVDVSDSDAMAVRRQRMAKDQKLEPGQVADGQWRAADLALGVGGDFTTHGRIDYVEPSLNPQNGTIRVRMRFENEDEFLLPGLFVRIRVPLETAEAILAPDIAMLSDQAGRFALVVNDQDVVELRHVKVGQLVGPLRVVVEGLALNDRIVVNGLQRARPGLKVRASMQRPEPAADAPRQSK